ncbi:uncharacterized protein LOC114353284 isoform X1 [Ostrinia furnacalis]|uniref:uncharacterized protein LOC114353284 isoform X1 n=2 Tax=Ostrinia furnacalis TaxID=93504 RepID=UPI00103EF0B2|nr:uncharacterized protein LOC114353284 isoform X1 [Ostrinia furnacalis]
MTSMIYLASCVLISVAFTNARSSMSKRTVLNEQYKGLVEAMAIPAELHERDGKRLASFGAVLPIHCAAPEQVEQLANTTHHYCDVFTDELLAPLGELAYVRIDENTAEKVFINRSKRILLISSDGQMAQWRCAATFESANQFLAGTPIVNKDGALVSVVTAKRGNNYAVSTFEGEGGYFETSEPWEVIDAPASGLIYGTQAFANREALRQHLLSLPAALVDASSPARPALLRGAHARIVLVARNGRQIAHHYLQGVLTNDIDYL